MKNPPEQMVLSLISRMLLLTNYFTVT